jgi:hypothetical protein
MIVRHLDPPCSTDGTWYNCDAGWTIINEEAGADAAGALERTAPVILKSRPERERRGTDEESHER